MPKVSKASQKTSAKAKRNTRKHTMPVDGFVGEVMKVVAQKPKMPLNATAAEKREAQYVSVAHVAGEVCAALAITGAYRATKYITEDIVVTACRRKFKGYSKTSYSFGRLGGGFEFVVTVGKPNCVQRQFIKKCRETGEPFPVKRVHFEYMPKRQPQKAPKTKKTVLSITPKAAAAVKRHARNPKSRNTIMAVKEAFEDYKVYKRKR